MKMKYCTVRTSVHFGPLQSTLGRVCAEQQIKAGRVCTEQQIKAGRACAEQQIRAGRACADGRSRVRDFTLRSGPTLKIGT